jgi:hypothetical protein
VASSTTSAAGPYAKQYLADVAPVNTLDVAFRKSHPYTASSSQTAPLAEAYDRLSHELLAQKWPPGAAESVRTLASDSEQVATVLRGGVGTGNAHSIEKYLVQMGDQAQTVRSKLGLSAPTP